MSFGAAGTSGARNVGSESTPRNLEPIDPIVELAEIAAELLQALDIIGQDMPRVQAILIPLSSRIAHLTLR